MVHRKLRGLREVENVLGFLQLGVLDTVVGDGGVALGRPVHDEVSARGDVVGLDGSVVVPGALVDLVERFIELVLLQQLVHVVHARERAGG